MSKTIVGAALFGLTVIVSTLGCGGGGDTKKEGAAPAGDAIGVAECDAYIAKIEACLPKMPPEGKPAQEQALKQSRETWKAAAAVPASKESLATTCKAALDAFAQNPICK